MESQENTTAPENMESVRKSYEVLLHKNKALHIKNKNLTTDKEALQKRLNNLMGQDTSSVPETRETDSQEQTTAPDDCESFCEANQVLFQKNKALRIQNKNMSADIEALQKKINDLTSQRTQATSLDAMAAEYKEKYLQNHKFWVEREENERNVKKTEEKLRLPKMANKETQTISTWQDLEDANKLLLQEKEAWETEKKKLQQETAILTKQKCDIEEKQGQAQRQKEDLQKELDAITKEAKMNLKAWEEEKETLRQEMAMLTKQKCEAEDKEKEAMQVNEALQREVQELQTLLQEEKQRSDINEARVRAHTREDELREALEEAEIVHSFDELLVEELREEVNVLGERVRVLEERQQSMEGSSFSSEHLGSEPDRLSLRRRFVRLFIPGWRRRYSSRETLDAVEPGEQAGEETERRLTLGQRIINSCNRRFRRTSR